MADGDTAHLAAQGGWRLQLPAHATWHEVLPRLAGLGKYAGLYGSNADMRSHRPLN